MSSPAHRYTRTYRLSERFLLSTMESHNPTACIQFQLALIVRVCLVREIKIFGCHIGCFGDVESDFWILIKKLIT